MTLAAELLARPSVPLWDADAADALLAERRAEVARVVEAFGGCSKLEAGRLTARVGRIEQFRENVQSPLTSHNSTESELT